MRGAKVRRDNAIAGEGRVQAAVRVVACQHEVVVVAGIIE